jgi:MFS family permease
VNRARTSSDAPQVRILRALQHVGFRRLYAATLLSQLGFWVSHMTNQDVARELSGASPEALGWLFFWMHLPQLALVALTGVAADRWNRRAILVLGYAVTAALIGLLAALVLNDALSLTGLYVIGFGLGLCNAWIGPTNMAAVANAVPARDLASAVSLGSLAMNLTRVVGPLVAAAILAVSTSGRAYLVVASALLLVTFLISRVELHPSQRDPEQESLIQRLRTGYAHARERQPALPILHTVGVMSIFGVSHVVLHPVFAERVLGNGSLFPLLGAASGAGAIVGALATGLRSKPLTLPRCGRHLLGFGLALMAFSQTTELSTAIATQVAAGYFYISTMTMMQTLVQQNIDDAKRGRVMSLFSLAWGGLITLGAPLMGQIAEHLLDTPATLLLGGAACAGFGLFRWLGGQRPRRYTADPTREVQ